jgi:hypothetical protein
MRRGCISARGGCYGGSERLELEDDPSSRRRAVGDARRGYADGERPLQRAVPDQPKTAP